VHVKGSLAGAYGDKRGKLEQANGGAIFLHEVGEIDASDAGVAAPLFGKREVRPVGSDTLHVASTRESSQPPIAISTHDRSWNPFAKICSTEFALCICMCRRCASAWRISGRC